MDKKDNQDKKVDKETDVLNPEALAKEEAVFDFGNDNDNERPKEEKTDFGRVRDRVLELEMQESYLDYAMSVIVARALPDVRDGLKPVHRRVLYSMHELGLSAKAKYRKSATVVGDVLGKYHPHGDIAVYDTLVRMAQDFSMRHVLVDGQGNFGSMDGDTAAAMRYTECRLDAIAEEMLADIEKDTVAFAPNYDGTRQEPKVLPAKLPNLLLNGTMGIAVGMATNIPPHNLGELIDAIIHLIGHRDCGVEDLMGYIKGPDFPTGAEIYGLEQIKNAYITGRGSIVMRAVANIEEQKRGGFRIIVSEIPYQVNKAELIEKIADLVKEKKIEGISGLRDESDRTEGVRIVIDLKATAYPKKVLNRLYELTNLQTAFHVNTLALIDGIQPRILTLKAVLDEYIKHRQAVVRRRTQFDLDRAKERAHILEGLLIALKNIDAVIETIKKSANREAAQKALISKFKLTEIQANAILEMRLASLAALERQKVEDEYKEKTALIKELEGILASEEKILAIIKKESLEIKAKYAQPRRTKIYEQEIGKFKAEDLIPSEQVVVILTKGNYIKRMPVAVYRSQIRGGRGVVGMETKEEDVIEHLMAADTHDDVMFFTDRGRVFQTKVYDIPSSSRLSKGQAIVNMLQISPDEKVTAVITINQKDLAGLKYFVMATEKGVVKKTEIALYKTVRKTGMVAIKLNAGDKLKWVKTTSGQDKILMASAKGQSIFYNEADIRPMGRSAAGVRGILLRGDDYVVAIDVVLPSLFEQAVALVVMENGFGKRTPLSHFKLQLRGGMGIRLASVTARTGKVVAMNVVYGATADVILASKMGQIIRMSLESIKILGRDTQGVTLVKLRDNDKVASATVATKSAEPVVQKSDEETQVQVIQKEDRPAQEVPKLEEVDAKVEAKKEAKELIKEEEKKDNQDNKLPDWAKAHHDSWREPSVAKLDKNIKVHEYKKDTETKKEKLKENDEPNYWGRRRKKI